MVWRYQILYMVNGRSGYVGQPLPKVEVRLVDDNGELAPPGTPGEIQVKGPRVFLEYWQNPQATAKAFRDGWFCTGDLAVVENGNYRILGQNERGYHQNRRL